MSRAERPAAHRCCSGARPNAADPDPRPRSAADSCAAGLTAGFQQATGGGWGPVTPGTDLLRIDRNLGAPCSRHRSSAQLPRHWSHCAAAVLVLPVVAMNLRRSWTGRCASGPTRRCARCRCSSSSRSRRTRSLALVAPAYPPLDHHVLVVRVVQGIAIRVGAAGGSCTSMFGRSSR